MHRHPIPEPFYGAAKQPRLSLGNSRGWGWDTVSSPTCLCTLVSCSRLFSRKEIFCFWAALPPASSLSNSTLCIHTWQLVARPVTPLTYPVFKIKALEKEKSPIPIKDSLKVKIKRSCKSFHSLVFPTNFLGLLECWTKNTVRSAFVNCTHFSLMKCR